MCPSRATKELHGPLGDTFFLDVKILARIRLCYILKLSSHTKPPPALARAEYVPTRLGSTASG